MTGKKKKKKREQQQKGIELKRGEKERKLPAGNSQQGWCHSEANKIRLKRALDFVTYEITVDLCYSSIYEVTWMETGL